MALQLTSPVKTDEGFTVTNAYGRVGVADQLQGTYLDSQVTLYVSEEEYLAGAQYLNVSNLSKNIKTPYDRTKDGVDVLSLAHDYLIAQLGSQDVAATKVL